MNAIVHTTWHEIAYAEQTSQPPSMKPIEPPASVCEGPWEFYSWSLVNTHVIDYSGGTSMLAVWKLDITTFRQRS